MKRLWSGVAGIVCVCALIFALPAMARVIEGTKGSDKLIGSNNGDRITAKRGDDIIRSRKGGDVLFAGGGNDFVKGGQGFDEIRTGRGDDEVHVRDGQPDLINCGPGEDTVLVDQVEEGIFDCEHVKEEMR